MAMVQNGQKHSPTSINSIIPCKSLESAKKAETIVYHNMKNYLGKDLTDMVRCT